MAKKVTKSRLSSKLSQSVVKAFEAHKADEVDYGRSFAELPGTIRNGIAKLVECKFGTVTKGDHIGEYYLNCRGVIVEPEYTPADDGGPEVKVVGRQTSIFQGLYEQGTRSVDDNVAAALNHLKLLGADIEDADVDDLEDIAAALKEEGPYFRFSTRRTEARDSTADNPKYYLNEYWNGACEYDEEEGPASEVVDGEAEEEPEEEPDDTETDGATDLSELGEAAEAGDGEAQSKLEDMAVEAGLDIQTLETWQDVATALAEAKGGEDESETAVVPSKDDIYYYKPKGKRKALECVVTMVFAKNESCNLKCLDDGKLHKQVDWSELTTGQE